VLVADYFACVVSVCQLSASADLCTHPGGVVLTSYKVGYFVGSLSSTSINRILSRALIRLAPEDLEFTEIPIANLPLYSQDYDANFPAEATALKEAIAASDAVLFVTRNITAPFPGH